ncbi:FAD/FMN-containing dehydrogenase [Nitrospirillum amazonense]|uniref:FAD/FMN-containing dehydrogenase n=1 Tax=Nitrospirillum amazonense TaxID=28077 RepID=A0A560F4U4_9PROT|nr:FAD-binding oxidoreductase [Nitrospirillum amazonense]TWB16633.1 FAD/FMN-containing dehydrogenase [Nitrospirillum amazonense]
MGAFETATARRSILKGLGALAVGASLPMPVRAQQFLADPGVELHPQTHNPGKGAWADLARELKGNVVLPDDPFFGDYSRPNNLRYATRPAGIARCTRAEDVSACLKWAKKTNTPFAVRSGGHNYAGFSTTHGLLIDMSPMAGITKLDDQRVEIRGGTINSLVYKALERMGRTVTHGRCDGVGAAGFLLGGGIGFNMRLYGIGSDLMRGTELVLADGERVSASADSHKELLWACQGGGGGNFGINTSFTVETYPVSTVTVFEITWTRDLERVLHGLLHQLQTAPNGFGSKISVTVPSREDRALGKGLSVSILGQAHAGTPPLPELFGPWLWEQAEKRSIHADMPYWQAQDILSEETFPYYYREQSTFLNTSDLTETVVANLIASGKAMPGTSMASAFKFFQVGGAVNKVGRKDTAFVHRGYDWLFSSEVNWWALKDSPTLVTENLAWQDKFYAGVRALTTGGGAYQNFPDASLKDWKAAYYAENYPDLQKVKEAVDPTSLFRFAQAITPA